MYHAVRHLLLSWGYWAVVAGLLGEDAGLPVPGETTLLFASFLAYKTHQLQLHWIIVFGVIAATTGDNIGYLLGRRFGSTLISWGKKYAHLNDTDIRAGKDLIRWHGSFTIFIARFIFGLRTIAGPLAGILDMEWRRFALFNFLGAATWVTAISLTGYGFGSEFQTLLDYFETAGWALAIGLFSLGYWLWRRQKKRFKQRQRQGSHTG